jgi:alpha-tubulin suppressor-like RCC1 family protein
MNRLSRFSGHRFAALAVVLTTTWMFGACGGDDSQSTSGTDGGIESGQEAAAMPDTGPVPPGDASALPFVTSPAVVAGDAFSCRVTGAGVVHCWGSADKGAIGDGIGVNRGDGPGEMGDALAAIDLGAGRTVVSASTFDSFSCALLDDATVKCWGAAAPGYGDSNDRGDQPSTEMGASLAALALGTGRTAKSVAVGGGHACVVLDDASLKCWGDNAKGQLGLGDTNPRGRAPAQMGDALPAVAVGTNRSVKAVATGLAHTCALLDDSTVKCWGDNTQGQLGLGDMTTRGESAADTPDTLTAIDLGGHTAKQIAAGPFHTCAILDDDGVKCWGGNAHGELGLGDTNARGSAAAQMGASLPEVSLGPGRTVKALRAGGSPTFGHTCAILDDATMKCWGANTFGELGLGDANARGDAANEMGASLPAIDLGPGRTAKAIAVGARGTCASLDDGSAKCWGANDDGELGQGDAKSRGTAPGQMGAALAAIDLGAAVATTAVAMGAAHACASLPNGKLKCWGSGLRGRIGVGTGRGDEPNEVTAMLAPVDLGKGRVAKQICAGTAFACAHLDDDTLKCWGENANGQLGQGDANARGDDSGEMGDALKTIALGTGRFVQSVSCGANHACAVLDDHSVKCWGDNAHGQLGLGDAKDRGTAAADMGDALAAVNVGTGRTARTIAAAGDTSCALLDDNSLKCWGRNDLGQLGLGDTTDRGTSKSQLGDALLAVSLGTGLSAQLVTAGANGTHRCAILADQSVKCWGDNAAAELGVGDLNPRGATPGTMGDLLAAVSLGPNIVPIALGVTDQVSCIADGNGAVRCFGTDTVGLFGKGSVGVVVGKSPAELGMALTPVDLGPGTPVKSLGVGGLHACALFDDQTVKCWGANDAGELGIGDTTSRGGAPNQMGSALPRLTLPNP